MIRWSILIGSLCFIYCGNSASVSGSQAKLVTSSGFNCSNPEKITAIYKDYVYDLSGYEGIAGNSAFNLFDENSLVDPKAKPWKEDYHPTSSPHPVMTSSFYYPKDRGNRIVIDLKVSYKLSEIYLYDMAREADSVWIYTGNMREWKLKAAMATKGDITQWGWRKLTINDSSQFLMIRFHSWLSTVTEAVLYGCPYSKPPAAPASEYTGPRLKPKPLREFLGINTYMEIPLETMKPFYNTRMYLPVDFFDRDTVNAYPNQLYNLAAKGWWNGAAQDYTFYADSIATYAKKKIWYSVMGVPYWMKKQGYDDRDRPITKLGMNKEDPMSYGRHANMLWNMAALYGNTKVDTNQLQVYNSPRFSGRGVMSIYENGNEVDANWVGDKYCNPIEYFAMSSADYDGHEKKLGPKTGIKTADPTAELMMSGMAGLDTNRVRILDFLCRNLRDDQQFLWKGGVQYHCYSVNGKPRFPAEAFSYADHGLSPEEDSLRSRLKKVRDYTYKLQPGVECVMGEYGYDKFQGSKVATPMVKGYDSKQSQGIMLLRGINAVAFSGFDRLILFWIKDDYKEGSKAYEAYFQSCGMVSHVVQNQFDPYPAWYYISTLVNRMGDYAPEKIISEAGKVWVYQYRSTTNPAAKAYFVYVPSHDGTVVDNFSLTVGKKVGDKATVIGLKEGSVDGNSSELPVKDGKISLRVTESPTLILVNDR